MYRLPDLQPYITCVYNWVNWNLKGSLVHQAQVESQVNCMIVSAFLELSRFYCMRSSNYR
jgi:hypothetical protein